MRSYTVHSPQPLPDDPRAQAEGLVFVREGFSWLALVVPALWLIYHRLWLVLFGFVVIVVLAGEVSVATGLDSTGTMLVLFAVQVLLAAEANDLRRWTMSRKGFDMIGLATGANIIEAELTFIHTWLARPVAPQPTPPAPPAATAVPQTLPAPVAGLFDTQGAA